MLMDKIENIVTSMYWIWA